MVNTYAVFSEVICAARCAVTEFRNSLVPPFLHLSPADCGAYLGIYTTGIAVLK
jgi:hypothetical protein